MKIEDMTATANEGKEKERALTVKLQVPETLAEAVEQFTEQVVFDVFLAQYKIKAQAYVRGQLAQEDKETGLFKLSEEEVIKNWEAWKLTGGNRFKLSPQERLKRAGKGMSKADILALLAEMDDEEFEDSDDSEIEESEDSGESEE